MPLAVGKPTIVVPGYDGGAEWGGPAVDRRLGILYVNSNDIAWRGSLTPNDQSLGAGERVYQEQCSGCHGDKLQGSPPQFPSLVDVGARMKSPEIAQLVHSGRGRMPGFPQLRGAPLEALLDFLTGARSDKQELVAYGGPQARYRFTGYRKWLDADGYPAVAPPWGTLSAIDLNSGDYLWRIPFGEYPELAAQGMVTGSENYGGPVVTASGLLFIGATIYDAKFRAFDTRTGALLWQHQLPYAGTATPITYMIGGKQYLIIATSNSRNPKAPQGSAYIAFALP
jgi:quinoprotein glucose dehydrogenase